MNDLANAVHAYGVDLVLFAYPQLTGNAAIRYLEALAEDLDPRESELIRQLQKAAEYERGRPYQEPEREPFERIADMASVELSREAAIRLASSRPLYLQLTTQRILQLQARMLSSIENDDLSDCKTILELLRAAREAGMADLDVGTIFQASATYIYVASRYLGRSLDYPLIEHGLEEATILDRLTETSLPHLKGQKDTLHGRLLMAMSSQPWRLDRFSPRVLRAFDRFMEESARRQRQRLSLSESPPDLTQMQGQAQALLESGCSHWGDHVGEAALLLGMLLRSGISGDESDSTRHRIAYLARIAFAFPNERVTDADMLAFCRVLVEDRFDFSDPRGPVGLAYATEFHDDWRSRVRRLSPSAVGHLLAIAFAVNVTAVPPISALLTESIEALDHGVARADLCHEQARMLRLIGHLQNSGTSLSAASRSPAEEDLEALSPSRYLEFARMADSVMGRVEADPSSAPLGVEELASALAGISPMLHPSSQQLLLAQVWLTAGELATSEGDFDAAASRYLGAIRYLVQGGMFDSVNEVLGILNRIQKNEHVPLAGPLLNELSRMAPLLETILGTPGKVSISQLWRRMPGLIRRAEIQVYDEDQVLYNCIQFANGLRTAARWARTHEGAEGHASTPASAADLRLGVVMADARYLREGVVASPPDSFADLENELGLVAPYFDDSEALNSFDRETRARNVEHALNRIIEQDYLDPILPITYLPLSELQGSLPEDVLVMALLEGMPLEGERDLYVLLVTREKVQRCFVTGDEGGDFSVRLPRQTLVTPLGEWWVAQARRQAILDEDELDGVDYLADWLQVAELLDPYVANGFSRLVVVPYGAYHFMPFHLLGKVDDPLAATWRVSISPSLRWVVPAGQSHVASGFRGAAFGISFENEESQLRLPNAEPEAGEVAAILQGRSYIGLEASKTAFLHALRTHSHVHLATHGEANMHAPQWQSVYLYDEAGKLARFHAAELVGEDLRSLRLVTLSACETALGRVDASSNPQGLVAALLACGVANVIGTLWQVDDECARTYFIALYQNLQNGGDVATAHWAAQQAARERFPRRADWGAFFLVGRGV